MREHGKDPEAQCASSFAAMRDAVHRGHASSRTPFLPKDNPFAISPSEFSIISNPSGLLKPLLSGQLPDNPFTGDDPVKIP